MKMNWVFGVCAYKTYKFTNNIFFQLSFNMHDREWESFYWSPHTLKSFLNNILNSYMTAFMHYHHCIEKCLESCLEQRKFYGDFVPDICHDWLLGAIQALFEASQQIWDKIQDKSSFFHSSQDQDVFLFLLWLHSRHFWDIFKSQICLK